MLTGSEANSAGTFDLFPSLSEMLESFNNNTVYIYFAVLYGQAPVNTLVTACKCSTFLYWKKIKKTCKKISMITKILEMDKNSGAIFECNIKHEY